VPAAITTSSSPVRMRSAASAIACTPEATRAQTEACYPQLKAFLAQKRLFDPAERIVNPWYRHYRNLFGQESCAVRWSHETPL